MATYNTGNALGSADPRDLLDNSQIADHYVSDTENTTWPDRFGNTRKTWKGIETDAANQLAAEESSFQQFLLNSGYEILADYTDGPITFERRNQITAYNGEYYRPKASVTLPYTTTGNTATTWATDVANFVVVGDAALRTELFSQSGPLLIGKAPSFSALRTIIPDSSGLFAELSSWGDGWAAESLPPSGGGTFVSVAGENSDDGGSICVPTGQNEFYWLRISDTVKTDDYGILFTDYNLTSTTDYSTSLQNAIDYAVKNKKPLECHIPTYGQDLDYGIYISKGINITGLSELIGNLNLFLNSANGFTGLSAPGIASPFALINLNGTFDSQGLVYNTSTGKQKLGQGIHLRQFAPRGDAYDLSGQCHVFSGTNWNRALTSRNFYGYGVYLGSCWDWTGNEIRTYGCGNTSYWGSYLGPYPSASGSTADETNNFHLNSLFVHDSYDKANYMIFTGGVIGHIHQERTNVTSTTAWVDESTTVSAGQTDYPYLNNFIMARNSKISQWGIYENAGIQTSNGSPCVTLMRTLGTDIGTMNASGQVAISPPLGATFADGNSFGVLVSGSLKINASAHVTASLAIGSSGTLLDGVVNCASNYSDFTSIQASASVNLSGGSRAGLVSCPTLKMNGAYVDRAISPVITMAGVSKIGYASSTTITSTGKSEIGGGSVGALNMNGSAIKSGSIVQRMSIGVLNSSEGCTLDNVAVSGDTTFTNCSPIVLGGSFYNVYYNGNSVLTDKSCLRDSVITNNLSINSYYQGKIDNCRIGASLQVKGASLAVAIQDTYAASWNMNCDSGYFTIMNPQGGSVAYWNLANNSPTLGSLVVKPDTGAWQRYTSSGWSTV